jgi:hypothetical protein
VSGSQVTDFEVLSFTLPLLSGHFLPTPPGFT